MTDEPENLTLRYLRAIDAKLDRHADDVGELKARIVSLDQRMAAIEQRMLVHSIDIGLVSQRFDRFDARLARIERRLDLVGGEVPQS
jgi:hypothetical protein